MEFLYVMKEKQFMMTFGMSIELVREVDQFAKLGDGKALTRSESIRQLIRIGLKRRLKQRRTEMPNENEFTRQCRRYTTGHDD